MSKDAMTDAMTGDVYPFENSIYDRLDKLTQRIATLEERHHAIESRLAKQRAVNVAVRKWITESAEQQDITVAGPNLLAVLHALGEAVE